MIVATGWTAAELRAQPARLVRALAWREFATRTWSPRLAEMAHVTPQRDGASAQQWLDQVKARDEAAAIVTQIEAVLWPEDDDG